jgi:hypothetical protein
MTTERKPRPHAEVIKKWADGYEVQHWGDLAQCWHDSIYPGFSPNTKYRIKPGQGTQPQPKEPTTWYQVVYKYRGNIYVTNDLFPDEASFESEYIGSELLKLIPIYTEKSAND